MLKLVVPKGSLERATFELTDAKARYFLVWITALDEIARIHEVRAR